MAGNDDDVPDLRLRVLARLEELQRAANPFVPQILSDSEPYRSTAQRAAWHRELGRRHAQVLGAAAGDAVIKQMAAELFGDEVDGEMYS